MAWGALSAVGSENSIILPFVVILPILLVLVSVNQTLPSDPFAIPSGPLFAVESVKNDTTPPGVTVPIEFAAWSANHRFPSGPLVI
jgi:hypothetical protein